MKRLIILLIAAISAHVAIAQYPGGTSSNGQGARKIPTIGHVYGKVTDASGKPIGGASVLVLQSHFDTATKKMKEILIKGSATENNGDFSLDELPIFGNLDLRISETGYAFFEQKFSFITRKPNGDSTHKPSSAA